MSYKVLFKACVLEPTGELLIVLDFSISPRINIYYFVLLKDPTVHCPELQRWHRHQAASERDK